MGIESPIHLLFIGIVALIVLGPKRLPELARRLGEGVREFREAIDAGAQGRDHPSQQAPTATTTATAATAATTTATAAPAGASSAAPASVAVDEQPSSVDPAGEPAPAPEPGEAPSDA
jgi:TatA/E family protein of Tat protein translocase